MYQKGVGIYLKNEEKSQVREIQMRNISLKNKQTHICHKKVKTRNNRQTSKLW